MAVVLPFAGQSQRTFSVKRTLHATKALALHTPPKFTVKDNVLIGEEKSVFEECKNVGELVLEKLNSYPNCIGQVDALTEQETTYAEMAEKSIKCAVWLKHQGIQKGDIIGICTNNHLNSYIPLLGALYVAAIANPWDHELSITSARYFLSLTNPKAVFVNVASVEKVAQAAKELNIDTKLITFGELPGYASLESMLNAVDSSEIKNFRCTEINSPNDIATIVCSSGTTGLPKGTQISHSAMINYMENLEIHNLEGHISMWIPTMRWYCGLFIILQAILKCSKRVIVPDYDNDEELCRFIEKYKVTWFRCDSCLPIRLVKVPGLLKKYKLPTLNILLFGGSHFRRELQEILNTLLPHVNVLQSYGMTDFGGLCTCQAKSSKPGSCGFICEMAQLKVVDTETGKVLSANQAGEIWAKSPYMMSGYYKNPKATADALDSNGWLHTGDIGYYDEDGEVFLVDRISEFINYRSINVSPAEIEALLQSQPSILEAAVVAIPHDIEEEHAMAFVVKVPGKEVSEEDLMNLVNSNLPWYSRLHAGVKFLNKLPRTPTGKIAKKELKELGKTLVATKTLNNLTLCT